MNQNIQDHRDHLETAILLAMSPTKTRGDERQSIKRTRKGELIRSSLQAFSPSKPIFPKHMFLPDASDPDRIYSGAMEDIIVDPISAIGQRLETGLMCDDGSLKWSALIPMKAPRGIVAVTNSKHKWFSHEFRHIHEGRNDIYNRRPIAITTDGKICKLLPLGWKGYDQAKDFEENCIQIALMLSVYEDAIRNESVIATVEEHCKVSFPIGEQSYKSFLSMRDGYRNTPTGKRNPIVHWCTEHFRRRGDKRFKVQRHDRGAEEFVVGPMKLTITVNTGY